MAEDQLACDVIRRLGTLKGLRSPHEDIWRECFDLSFPIRSQGFNGDTEDIQSVAGKRARLFDSTSTDAGRILASGIQSGMTPANSRWFGMTVWDETDEERRWLDESAERLWESIHASNFDADAFESQLDIVGAGWFVLFMDNQKDDDGSITGLRFEQWPISGCYCAASKPGGEIDTIYRPYQLTVEQCVAEFGLAKCSEKVRRLYIEGKYDEPINLVHAIYPRRVSMVNAKRAKNLPYASVHVDCDDKAVLRESGYHEKPFAAPRWTVIPKSVYAVGPMFDAIPDIKTLNHLVRMEEMGVDIAVSGMWVAEDDGVLNPRTVKVGPRKIIVANSVDSIKPLTTGVDFNVSFTKKEQLQAAVRKMLMADQLQPQDGPAMTATEVHVRVQLIRQLLGPVYGRLQAEYLKPLIQRCFGLAFRAGLFDAPPESLGGRTYTITYMSPLAKSQKLEEVSATEGTLASIAALADAKQDPSVWDNINSDEAVRVIVEGRGAPAKIGNTAEEVAAIRKRRAEKQEAEQQQAQQQQIAQVAGEAAATRMAEAA